MRKLIVTVAICLLVGAPAWGGVQNSKHDLSTFFATTTETCVFCHTPHQTDAAGGQDPLWNHSVSTQGNYGVYASDTMNASPTNFGGGSTAGSLNVSQLCMSCHDGTVAIGALYNPPNSGLGTFSAKNNVDASQYLINSAKVGTDLTNDHPINFDYGTAITNGDTELTAKTSNAWVDGGKTVPLFGGYVQCASCHDPHNTTYKPFLVKSNDNSGLCTTCHTK